MPEVVITNPTCIDFEEKNAGLDVIRPPAGFIKTLKITSDSEAVFSQKRILEMKWDDH